MSSYIVNDNSIIKIICVNEITLRLKQEIGEYYQFVENIDSYDFTIYIFTEHEKYGKVTKRLATTTHFKEMLFFKERESIIFVNCKKKEMIIFYDKINDNIIQFIGEIVISIFGMMLEHRKYSFVHAACVEQNGNAIAIIGNRNSGKTTILNALLQENYNFICNSHLALRNNEDSIIVEGFPTRMGIRLETLNKIIKPEIREKIIEKTEFKSRFGDCSSDNLKNYSTKKFNIKVNQIKEIYKVQLVKRATLKLMIIPVYNTQFTSMRVKEMNGREKYEIIAENRRIGIYDSVKYLKTIDNNVNKIVKIPTNMEKIKMLKVYQNEHSMNELINLIKSKLI